MNTAKPVTLPLANHFKLDDSLSPVTNKENDYMINIPYTNAIGSLMYSMVSTRLDIFFAMSVLSKYM